jgi:hypothetical protein
MANTYNLIETKTIASLTATVIFSSIPQTYTDLKIVWSARTNWSSALDTLYIRFNSNSSSYQTKQMLGFANGGNVYSESDPGNTSVVSYTATGSTAYANSFGAAEMYIPNYTSSTYKNCALDGVLINDVASNSWTNTSNSLWSNSAAINSITFTSNNGASFVANSVFSLYGIKNS